MGILEVPRNDRDFEDKSENDEVAQEDNVEEGNYYRFIAIEILYFYLTIKTQLWLNHSDSKSPILFTNSKMVKLQKIFFLCFR